MCLLRACEREAEGVEGLLALEPAFFAVDADAEPEVSEAAFNPLALGSPLDDGHHVQKFRVCISADGNVDGIVQVSVRGFEKVRVDGIGIRWARLRGDFHTHDATSFTESAVVRGVALLAFTPFAVRPVEAHGHQGVKLAGPHAEG